MNSQKTIDQSQLNTILLQTLYESDQGDINVKTSGDFDKKLSITILAIASPVFKSMFEHEMKEKQTKIILIEEYDDEVVDNFFRYVYYKKIPEFDKLSVEQRFQSLGIFDKYQIADIVPVCQKLILEKTYSDQYLESLLECKKYPELTKDIFEYFIDALYRLYNAILHKGVSAHVNCYDAIHPEGFGKPKHHNFQMCCIHQDSSWLLRASKSSRADTTGKYTCTAWKMEGKTLEETKKLDAEFNYCCYHRQFMDVTKKIDLPAIGEYQNFLHKAYKDFMSLPDDIRERVHGRMFLGIGGSFSS